MKPKTSPKKDTKGKGKDDVKKGAKRKVSEELSAAPVAHVLNFLGRGEEGGK